MHVKTILLTRPSGVNKPLADLFHAEGLSPIVRPLIELVEKAVDQEMKQIALDLDRYDKIIFVSKLVFVLDYPSWKSIGRNGR